MRTQQHNVENAKSDTAPPRHRLATGAALLMLLAWFLAPAAAIADEQAFIWNEDDADLEWGPCPEFFPEGCALAVLQGDPEQPNADVFLRVPGNSTLPHHRHTSAERMVLIAGEFEVDYDGQDPVVMQAGTYAYGPAELPHVAHCRSDEECVLFIAFEEPVDVIPTEE